MNQKCTNTTRTDDDLTLRKSWKPLLHTLKGDSHLKHNSLISTIPWLSSHALTQGHFSLTYLLQASIWGSLPSTASVSTLTCPFPIPSFRMAHDTFQPNLFPHKYSKNLIPVILPAYTAYEDGTGRVFQNVGI